MTCRICTAERCKVHCVWCGVDCDLDDPPHNPDCPQETGLYPADGEMCWDCEQPVGDYYVHRYAEGTYDVLCLGCGILNG